MVPQVILDDHPVGIVVAISALCLELAAPAEHLPSLHVLGHALESLLHL